MISNAGVHRGGEFVFNDYVYDDHGANTDTLDRRDLPFGAWPSPQHPTDARVSPTGGDVRYTGDFMYATEDDHLYNVADLVEFRVAADATHVNYRATLNALHRPDAAVVGVCVDEDRRPGTGLHEWPRGAGLVDRLGCDHFLTVWGTGGEALRGGTKTTIDPGDISVDLDANTIDWRVPRSFADPDGKTWRYYVAAGLWDDVAGAWLAPLAGPQVIGAPVATGWRPGVPVVWDLLSNNNEPNSYWLEERQANDLATHNVLEHYVDVDFAKLASGVVEPDPQRTGVILRLYKSAFDLGEGLVRDAANFEYRGAYQPYAMAIPSNYYRDAASGKTFAFDQCLHPLNGNHMVEIYYSEAFAREGYNPLVSGTTPMTGYLGFDAFEALVDRLQTVYACVLGRGEGVGYTGGDGTVDVVEVWRDVESRYGAIDHDRKFLHGISLGAIGTFHMAPLYPDRYAAIMPVIFSPNIVNTDFSPLRNLYNVPTFFTIGTLDQFGQGIQGDPTADAMEEFGNEYVYVHWLGRQHEGRILADALPFIEPLAYDRRRDPDPYRVRYRFDPSRFSSKIPGAGEAYWVRGMMQRDTEEPAEVDVRSQALTAKAPRKQVTFDGVWLNTVKGYLTRIRGQLRMTKTEFDAFWQPAAWEAGWTAVSMDAVESDVDVLPADATALTADLVNTASVTIDPARAGLSREVLNLRLRGDGPTTIRLLGLQTAGSCNEAVCYNDGDDVVVEVDLSGGAPTDVRVYVS